MKKGIHHEIEMKRRHVEGERAAEKSVHADPRDAHEAGERAKRLDRELVDLCHTAHSGESAAEGMAKAIARMEEMPVKGRELSLAITHAEDALHRLRRHLGDKPRD
jgi:hypothetical protein